MSIRHHLFPGLAAGALLALAGCTPADDTGSRAPQATEATVADATPPASELMALPPTPPLGDRPTALDITAIVLGTRADADGAITTPMTTFGANDNIAVSVSTAGGASSAQVTARLIAADGQPVAEQSTTITQALADTRAFVFDAAEPWPTGEYSVQVLVNGNATDARAGFTVE